MLCAFGLLLMVDWRKKTPLLPQKQKDEGLRVMPQLVGDLTSATIWMAPALLGFSKQETEEKGKLAGDITTRTLF